MKNAIEIRCVKKKREEKPDRYEQGKEIAVKESSEQMRKITREKTV